MTSFSASFLTRLGRIFLVLALACAGGAVLRAADVDPDVEGTMPEDYFPALKVLIAEGLKQSPQMISKEMDLEAAYQQKLYNGVAPLLPSLGGYLQGGEQSSANANDPTQSNRNSAFVYDVTLRQPVFQWGALKNNLLQAKISVAITQRNYATVYLQFTQKLRSDYLGLIGAKISLRNTRFGYDLRKRALDAVQQQFKAGQISPGAVFNPQMDETDAKIALDSAEESYRYARLQFAREIGRSDFADADVPSAVPEPRFSTSAASDLVADVLRTGARYTPDSQLALLNIRNLKLQYDIQKVNLAPKLSLQSELNRTSQSIVQSGTLQQSAVTQESYYLRADWNIFDGFATRGRKAETLIHRRQAERDLKVRVEATLDAAQYNEHQVEFAWRALDSSTRRDNIAQAVLRRAEDDLANHVGSPEALAGARAGAFNSELGLIGQRANFITQWAAFVSSVGHDPAMNNLPARYVRPIQ